MVIAVSAGLKRRKETQKKERRWAEVKNHPRENQPFGSLKLGRKVSEGFDLSSRDH